MYHIMHYINHHILSPLTRDVIFNRAHTVLHQGKMRCIDAAMKQIDNCHCRYFLNILIYFYRGKDELDACGEVKKYMCARGG